MPYYPKSQVKTNLYTNVGFYLLSTTQEPYQGYYYETSNGNKYTGKTPQNPPNILLIPINDIFSNLSNLESNTLPSTPTIIFETDIIDYPEYKSLNLKERYIPQFNLTLPTAQDQ